MNFYDNLNGVLFQTFHCMEIGHICECTLHVNVYISFKPEKYFRSQDIFIYCVVSIQTKNDNAYSLGAGETINCLPRLLLTNIMNNKQTKKSNKFSTSLEMKRDEIINTKR